MPSFDLRGTFDPYYPNKSTINGVDMHTQTVSEGAGVSGRAGQN